MFEKNYAPAGKWLWDPWFVKHLGLWHMFHLQAKAEGDYPQARHHNKVSIGHAISSDLVNWQELPTALTPGESGSWDDVSLWTGSTIIKDNTAYMFYTGRTQAEFFVQRIGFATSRDDQLVHWEKFSHNPVIVADGKMYDMVNEKNALGVVPAWRDPFVFYDAMGDSYYALITARKGGQSPEYNGCIGRARSHNLLHWTLTPPLLAPHLYDEMEVPQMVEHNNRHYLFFSTSPQATRPSWRETQGTGHGLHCYVAEDFGIYKPVNGNGVVQRASKPGEANVLGLRLLGEPNGNVYTALGWINVDGHGNPVARLSDPYEVTINGDSVSVKAV